MELKDIYRISNSTKILIFVMCTENVLQERSYVITKISLTKFKVEIISSVLFDHNGIK